MVGVCVDKDAMKDLVRLVAEMNERMESLFLMSDAEIVAGNKRAKKQIEERDFGDLDEL
ncbi:MAG: hypothetical protein V1889_00125 [archaeon]